MEKQREKERADRLKEGLRTSQVLTEQWTTRRPRHSVHRQEVHNARNTLFSSLFTRCGLVKARNVHDRARSENASARTWNVWLSSSSSPLSLYCAPIITKRYNYAMNTRASQERRVSRENRELSRVMRRTFRMPDGANSALSCLGSANENIPILIGPKENREYSL